MLRIEPSALIATALVGSFLPWRVEAAGVCAPLIEPASTMEFGNGTGGRESADGFTPKARAAFATRGRANGLAHLDISVALPEEQMIARVDSTISPSGAFARTPASKSFTDRLPLSGGRLTGPLALPRLQVGSVADPNANAPIYSYAIESASPGPGVFGPSHIFVINRVGGDGNREAVHVEADSNVGQIGDQIVGALLAGRIVSGAGTAYGANPYARVDPGADPGSQTVGEEVNTDARRDVAAKVGSQIIDVSTSIGKGTAIDTALLFGRQIGARGFGTGLQFGYTAGDASYGVAAGGTLINSLGTTIQFRAGLDLSQIERPFSDAAIKLAPGNAIRFGDGSIGGSIVSRTAASAGALLFDSNLTILDFGGTKPHTFTPTGYTTTGAITEATASTPAGPSAPCTIGQHAWDANYEYRCVAPNQWKRAALSSW